MLTRLDNGETPLLLYIYGEDSGRLLSFVDRLVHQCLGESIREFNYNVLDAKETPMERVLEVALTLPVLASYRVVLVRNSASFGQNDWAYALSYLQAPSSSTCLIFRGEKPSISKEAAGAIQTHGAILEFRPRSERQAQHWLTERVRREGKRILPEAVQALIERVGTRQGDLEGEIEKILIYIGEEKTIREEHVQELSVGARAHRVFDLTDALVEKRSADALNILHRLLEDGSSPLALVGIMARQVRLIWSAKEFSKQGKSTTGWPKGFSVPPFVQKRLLSQAKKWNEDALSRALEGLYQVDRSLKRGRLDPEILLDRWVLNTVHHPGKQ